MEQLIKLIYSLILLENNIENFKQEIIKCEEEIKIKNEEIANFMPSLQNEIYTLAKSGLTYEEIVEKLMNETNYFNETEFKKPEYK
jgi:hypothetical protein